MEHLSVGITGIQAMTGFGGIMPTNSVITKKGGKMIHTVRQPFMCRKDQFKKVGYPGQVLVVGIAVAALSSHNPYQFRIRNNQTIHSGNSQVALSIAYIWRNKTGKPVAIIPVDFFKSEETKQVSQLSFYDQPKKGINS